jgi:hypothetical protein
LYTVLRIPFGVFRDVSRSEFTCPHAGIAYSLAITRVRSAGATAWIGDGTTSPSDREICMSDGTRTGTGLTQTIVWSAVIACAVLGGTAAQAQPDEPPHPILAIPGDGSGAEAILATYNEQQFLEYVPRQSPRNPELSGYGAILVAGDTRWS